MHEERRKPNRKTGSNRSSSTTRFFQLKAEDEKESMLEKGKHIKSPSLKRNFILFDIC
jgi:hypothetical protein